MHEMTRLESGQIFQHHHRLECSGVCCLHGSSPYETCKQPRSWRGDRHILEHHCPCGIGHPCTAGTESHFLISGGEVPDTTHGCCGQEGHCEPSRLLASLREPVADDLGPVREPDPDPDSGQVPDMEHLRRRWLEVARRLSVYSAQMEENNAQLEEILEREHRAYMVAGVGLVMGGAALLMVFILGLVGILN